MAYEKQFTNGRLSEIEDSFMVAIAELREEKKSLEYRICILEGMTPEEAQLQVYGGTN